MVSSIVKGKGVCSNCGFISTTEVNIFWGKTHKYKSYCYKTGDVIKWKKRPSDKQIVQPHNYTKNSNIYNVGDPQYDHVLLVDGHELEVDLDEVTRSCTNCHVNLFLPIVEVKNGIIASILSPTKKEFSKIIHNSDFIPHVIIVFEDGTYWPRYDLITGQEEVHTEEPIAYKPPSYRASLDSLQKNFVKAILEGPSSWDRWRKKNFQKNQYIDLSFVNLQRANMEKYDLSYVNFSHSNLCLTNLKDTNLYKSNLSNALLIDSNLIRANLRGAYIRSANLIHANLEKADLSLSQCVDSNFELANLIDTNFDNSNLDLTNFSNANLSNSSLKYSTGFQSYFGEANLEHTNISNGFYMQTNFYSTNLYMSNLKNIDLTRAHLSGANFNKANLTQANLKTAYLKEASFEGAILTDANFERVEGQEI